MSHFAAYPDDPDLYRVKRRPKRASSSAWALRVTTSCLAVAGLLVLADFAVHWTRAFGDQGGRTTDPTPMVVFVGDDRLTIPSNMIRFETKRTIGPHEEVELALHWPSLQGYTLDRRPDFLDGGADAPILYITIRRRTTATDSAGRLASVYQHFFDPQPLPAPEGLAGRRLAAESGLGGEEVYFEKGSVSPFTIHCLPSDDSGYPAPCLSEIHAGNGLSVQLRFRKGLVTEWQGIRDSTRGLLASFGILS